ncbi:uncharacterized protein [Prorops nasuta]|uniref:uncharacterized protein n=1 Tax=Prorops nasuta TaxID=863751 RepID=UPI0034CFD1EA
MAVGLLGKCAGLLALLILLYGCSYAFRIRDVAEHCGLPGLPNKCPPEKTSTSTTTTPRARFGLPRPSKSQPPAVGGLREDERNTRRSRLERLVNFRIDRIVDEDDDEEALVEVEDSDEVGLTVHSEPLEGLSDESEYLESDDDEDEDDDDDPDDDGSEEDDDEEEEDGEEDDYDRFTDKNIRDKVIKSDDRDLDDDDDEEDEDALGGKIKLDVKKKDVKIALDKIIAVSMRNRKKSVVSASKDESERDDDDDDESADDKEELDDKRGNDEEEKKEKEEVDEEEPKSTGIPKKLETVRIAEKVKEAVVTSKISTESSKVEAKKPSDSKVELEPKKIEKEKIVEKSEKAEKVEQEKIAEKLEKVEKVEKLEKRKEQEKVKAVKSEPPKPTLKPKSEPKKSEKEKSKKKPVKEEKHSKKDVAATPKVKKQKGAALTLYELNDALLQVSSFVPNFTAVEDSICQQHGKIFLRQLRGYKLWALQMLDSSAKVPSGLLRGNVNQMGDFDQCLGIMARVKVDEKTVKVQGKYCLATVDLHAAHPGMKFPVNLMQSRAFIRGRMHDPGHFIPRFTTVNWALCLPAACSADDAKHLLEITLEQYNISTGIRFTVDVNPQMCYVRQKSLSYSKETIGVLYFYAMIICLVFVATVRDYLVVSQGRGTYSERIIMSFSLRRTFAALVNRETSASEDISCIHGIRSIATMALYLAHKLIPIARLPFANRVSLTEVANNPISSVLRVSLVYTDAFLLLSGVLTSYNMAKELQHRGEIRWFCRFIARYVRLTPALLVVVFWYAFVMEHTGSGPQWSNVITQNAELCKQNSWTNLLYIQNFFPFEEMCASHTHQLALDMQLSILAPMLVFFLYIKPIIGIIIMFFILLVSATVRYIATINNYLSLVIFHGMSLKQLYKTANLTYILPLHRATPYVLGVGLGTLLHYTGKNVKIHKVVVILGWLIALILGSWSLFSPWRLAKRDYVYDAEEATHYAVISPVSWALTLCWIIFACFTNHGGFMNKFLSNHWLILISRISYAVYLTQFAIFFYNVGTTRYSSEFQVHTVIDLFELAAVISVSVILTLFFDIPMQEAKKVIMEITDGQVNEITDKDGGSVPKENRKETEKEKPMKDMEEDEVASTGWDWQQDIGRVAKQVRDSDDESVDVPKLRRRDARRKSFIGHEAEEAIANNRTKYNHRALGDEDIRERRSKSELRPVLRHFEDEHDEIRRERRSQPRSLEKKFPEDEYYASYGRPESRGRSHIREPEERLSWEFVNSERSSSRDPERRYTTPGRKVLSSESEEEIPRRRRQPVVEPRVSDEEDWEQELRIRRKQFRDKVSSHDRSLGEEEDFNLKRRSSAEGKIALLQEPVTGNMDSWTISKVPASHFGTGHDSSEPEENTYTPRREYREQAPPFRDDVHSEEDGYDSSRRRSHTSTSQVTSIEDDDDVASYDFILRKESKRASLQDLSKSPQDESEEDSGWNMVRQDSGEQPKATLGLYKRESIIKSQASEEDPEYLLPERPKLVEQEQEHPFKKAWQMQKSRSEEDGSAAYVVKETPKKKDDESSKKQELNEEKLKKEEKKEGGEALQDVGCVTGEESDATSIWQTGSSDERIPESICETDEEFSGPSKFEWPNEDRQFETYKKGIRRRSEEAFWDWEEEET